MKHLASPRFWSHYRNLPDAVRHLADKNFELLKADPHHPSLHLKKLVSCGRFELVLITERWAGIRVMVSSGFGLDHTRITISSCDHLFRVV